MGLAQCAQCFGTYGNWSSIHLWSLHDLITLKRYTASDESKLHTNHCCAFLYNESKDFIAHSDPGEEGRKSTPFG